MTDQNESQKVIQRIQITSSLDRQALESLILEIRSLAKRHGVQVKNVRIVKDSDESLTTVDGEETVG